MIPAVKRNFEVGSQCNRQGAREFFHALEQPCKSSLTSSIAIWMPCTVVPDDIAREAKLAMAARLIGMDRVTFLAQLQRFVVPPDVAEEVHLGGFAAHR